MGKSKHESTASEGRPACGQEGQRKASQVEQGTQASDSGYGGANGAAAQVRVQHQQAEWVLTAAAARCQLCVCLQVVKAQQVSC